MTNYVRKLSNITERITVLAKKAAEADGMREELSDLKIKLRQQENYSISSELRINEIPYSQDENLREIFNKICNTINKPVTSIQSIYRLSNHNNKRRENSKDAAIIMKL